MGCRHCGQSLAPAAAKQLQWKPWPQRVTTRALPINFSKQMQHKLSPTSWCTAVSERREPRPWSSVAGLGSARGSAVRGVGGETAISQALAPPAGGDANLVGPTQQRGSASLSARALPPESEATAADCRVGPSGCSRASRKSHKPASARFCGSGDIHSCWHSGCLGVLNAPSPAPAELELDMAAAASQASYGRDAASIGLAPHAGVWPCH